MFTRCVRLAPHETHAGARFRVPLSSLVQHVGFTVSRSNNRQFLFRRIAWRIQALAEGGLSERARRRALEIANDADIRVRAPNKKALDPEAFLKVTERLPKPHDSRLPPPGAWLERNYRGQRIAIKVRIDGFEFEGRVYRR